MPVFLSFVVMNEERFILAWNTPLPDAAFKLTIYLQYETKPFHFQKVVLHGVFGFLAVVQEVFGLAASQVVDNLLRPLRVPFA
jgi:hypothetical protein